MQRTSAGRRCILLGGCGADTLAMLPWIRHFQGFTRTMKLVQDGLLVNSQPVYGDGLVMVCGDNVDALCAPAREAGAPIVARPADHGYGEGRKCDCVLGARDPEGRV